MLMPRYSMKIFQNVILYFKILLEPFIFVCKIALCIVRSAVVYFLINYLVCITLNSSVMEEVIFCTFLLYP